MSKIELKDPKISRSEAERSPNETSGSESARQPLTCVFATNTPATESWCEQNRDDSLCKHYRCPDRARVRAVRRARRARALGRSLSLGCDANSW